MRSISEHRSAGFSKIVILAIVACITLLLIVVGVLVSGNDAGDSNESTSENIEDQSNQNTKQQYLLFTEYRVRLPLSEETEGLLLGKKLEGFGDETDTLISIGAPTLNDGWNCEANPDTGFYGSIGFVSIVEDAKRSSLYEPDMTKTIDGITFGYTPEGEACTDSPEFDEMVQAFKAQFPKLEKF